MRPLLLLLDIFHIVRLVSLGLALHHREGEVCAVFFSCSLSVLSFDYVLCLASVSVHVSAFGEVMGEVCQFAPTLFAALLFLIDLELSSRTLMIY